MFEAVLTFSVVFFSVFAVLSSYLGMANLIYPSTAVASLIISLIASLLFFKKIKPPLFWDEGEKKAVVWMGIFFVLCLMISLWSGLYLVFPHGAGDFANHARSVRIIAKQHHLYENSSYPQIYYALASMIYSIYPHTYPVNSLLGILFMTLSSIPVFLIAKRYFNSKVASYSVFFYLFSITSLFILEQGYFIQIMGQFFLVSAIYYLIERRKYPLFLSILGLYSYFVYFLIFLIYTGLLYIMEKGKSGVKGLIILPIVSSFVVWLPLLYRFFIIRFKMVTSYKGVPLRHLLLMKGGVLTPTYISILFFLPAIYFLFQDLKRREWKRLLLLIAPSIFVGVVLLAFIYVYLSGYTSDIRHLYLAAKTYYFAVFPISLYLSLAFERPEIKRLSSVFLVIYFSYFLFYSVSILPSKSSLDNDFYAAAEYLDTLPEEFRVGIDPALFNNLNWTKFILYESVFDVPDRGYETGGIARSEISRSLQFHWANYRFENREIVVFGSDNKSVIYYGMEGVDYFVTKKNIPFERIAKFGDVNVYKANG